MKRFTKKKNILVLIAIVYVIYTFANQTITMYSQKKEIIKFKQELQNAKDYNQKLKDDITISGTESYIEKLARERLGLVKDGDDIIMDNK